MSDVKLGLGDATGMFYHAPAGTALPSLGTAPGSTWKKVGDVTDAGITLAFNKSVTNLKNWANQIKRAILTDHSETIQSPIMDTTEESLKTTVGSKNVTKANGVITVNLSDTDLPAEEAFLWLMKDGNDLMGIGCSYGQVTAVDNVSFAPNNAVNWTPTITALRGGFQFLSGPVGATGSTS